MTTTLPVTKFTACLKQVFVHVQSVNVLSKPCINTKGWKMGLAFCSEGVSLGTDCLGTPPISIWLWPAVSVLLSLTPIVWKLQCTGQREEWSRWSRKGGGVLSHQSGSIEYNATASDAHLLSIFNPGAMNSWFTHWLFRMRSITVSQTTPARHRLTPHKMFWCVFNWIKAHCICWNSSLLHFILAMSIDISPCMMILQQLYCCASCVFVRTYVCVYEWRYVCVILFLSLTVATGCMWAWFMTR